MEDFMLRRKFRMNFLLQRLAARGVLTSLAALLALVLFSGAAFAQTETGQITGNVTDPTGAVVAGATVTVRSVDTKAQRQTTTNENGNFTVPSLLPGVYEVVVEAAGFSTKTLRAQVTVGSRISVDASLTVGGEQDVVDVIANEGIQVNTNSQELSDVVSQKQLVELPTITRNPYALVQLSGNIATANPVDSGPTDRGVGVAINGQRSSSTNITLDGADNNDNFTATVGQNIPLDSVQEFSVITSNFSAEFGRATGGIVNVATKAGTNEFHGSVYEFNRISDLASNTLITMPSLTELRRVYLPVISSVILSVVQYLRTRYSSSIAVSLFEFVALHRSHSLFQLLSSYL
jgi:hypothetical protein